MEYESGLAADAATLGEQRLSQFLAAVDELRLPGLTYRVVNNVITPAETGAGVAYTRNIVFTLPNPAGEPAGRDRVVAKLEDLGARYNSHCVTCIGSG